MAYLHFAYRFECFTLWVFDNCLSLAGVGIGVVDVGYERRLANHLGAHRTPSILGVVNGKVTFFHYAVVREHLKQFVEDLLPQRLVEKVSASADVKPHWLL